MIMNSSAAYGMFSRTATLSEIVAALNRAGFGKEDICMVLSPAHPDAAAVSDANLLDAKSSERNTCARMIRWFCGLGAVVIPTVGFFARSQAFLNALVTEHNIPSLSRGSRTLLGLGFSPDDAKRLGNQLADVGALVYVACKGSASAADGAMQLMRNTGAREAATLQQFHTAAAA
jgi:hypothetical protein